jgi:hypothetical protein
MFNHSTEKQKFKHLCPRLGEIRERYLQRWNDIKNIAFTKVKEQRHD